MKIIRDVSFEEIKKVFLQEHRQYHGTNSWALATITEANKLAGGLWSYVELEPVEASNVFLPWHEWDCKKYPVISRGTKMNVNDTVKKIKSDENYSSANPDCWAKIDYCSKQETSLSIFISTKPVIEIPEYRAYADMVGEQGNLFHLDGFHRLVNWDLNEHKYPVFAYLAWVK